LQFFEKIHDLSDEGERKCQNRLGLYILLTENDEVNGGEKYSRMLRLKAQHPGMGKIINLA
jgi:hypothetical protein